MRKFKEKEELEGYTTRRWAYSMLKEESRPRHGRPLNWIYQALDVLNSTLTLSGLLPAFLGVDMLLVNEWDIDRFVRGEEEEGEQAPRRVGPSLRPSRRRLDRQRPLRHAPLAPSEDAAPHRRAAHLPPQDPEQGINTSAP